MSTFFNQPRPQLAPSLLQHLLAQTQEALSAEAGFPVLLTLTVGYDGTYFEAKLHNFESDDGWSDGCDLELALSQATDMIVGMNSARVAYRLEVSAEV